MNELADALKHELQGLEILLHRMTTLRLMMATGTQRSIERAAGELDEALAALNVAESARAAELSRAGFTDVAQAIDASDEPLRSDLTLTRTRLQRTHQEVLGAASATSSMASRSLAHVQGTLQELGVLRGGATEGWRSYGPGAGARSTVGFVEGSI